jgi:hypothetical protein
VPRYQDAKFELLAFLRWYGSQWMDFGLSVLLTTGSGFETGAPWRRNTPRFVRFFLPA